MKTKFQSKAGVAILAIVATAQTAQAQTVENPASAENPNEIIVTASKTGEQTLLQAPLAIQAFSTEDLRERNITDATNLVTSIPGASIAQDTGAGIRSYNIRGVGSGGTNGDTPIGYYLDDVPFVVTNFGIAPPIRFLDIERVEVLRGPQGTLYGQGSAGGTMIFHTRRPDLNELTLTADAATSRTTDASSWNWDFSGALSLPLVQDVLAVRFSGGMSRQQGYADVYHGLNDGTPDELDANAQESSDWRVALLFQPSESVEIQAQVWQFESNQGYGSFYSSVDPYAFLQTGAIEGYGVGKYTLYSLAANIDLGGAELTSSTSYLDGYFGNRIPLGEFGAVGGKFDSFFSPTNFNQEVRLRSDGSGPLNWVVGANYQNGRGPQSNLLDFVFFQIDGSNNTKTESYAGFGEISYELFDGRLVPLVGIRYYHDRRVYSDAASTQPDTLNKTTWRANLSYYPSDDVTLFATVSTGFRVNTIQSQVQVDLLTADGVPTSILLDPLSLTNYEAGIKARALDGDLRFGANLYHIKFEGVQSSVVSSTGVGGFAVLGDAHSTGIDLDVAWDTPLRGLTLSAVANFSSNKFDAVNPLITAQRPLIAQGERLTNTADSNFRLDASYTTSLGDDWELFANANYARIGSRPTIADRTADPYSLIGASLGLRRGDYEVSVFGTNLGDERGPFDFFPPVYVSGPIPRTIGLRLRKTY